MPVTVGGGNTALPAEANRSLEIPKNNFDLMTTLHLNYAKVQLNKFTFLMTGERWFSTINQFGFIMVMMERILDSHYSTSD